MFKAKLIEDPKYYAARRLRVILYFLPAIPVALLINYYNSPIWLTVAAFTCYIVILIIGLNVNKKIKNQTKNNTLELDENMIRIRNKDGKSSQIPLSEITRIEVPKEVRIPEESMKDIGNELSGNPRKNFLVVSGPGGQQRFDFEIDSYYMINQLNSILDSWSKKGSVVERV